MSDEPKPNSLPSEAKPAPQRDECAGGVTEGSDDRDAGCKPPGKLILERPAPAKAGDEPRPRNKPGGSLGL